MDRRFHPSADGLMILMPFGHLLSKDEHEIPEYLCLAA